LQLKRHREEFFVFLFLGLVVANSPTVFFFAQLGKKKKREKKNLEPLQTKKKSERTRKRFLRVVLYGR